MEVPQSGTDPVRTIATDGEFCDLLSVGSFADLFPSVLTRVRASSCRIRDLYIHGCGDAESGLYGLVVDQTKFKHLV